MSLVETTVRDGVAVVRLNDPDRRNAITEALVAEVCTTFDQLEAGRVDRSTDANGEVGAVVVTGSGRAFCAGADLSQLGESERDGLKRIYEGFLRVARCPLPTIAAVNGAAVGAGMNLALACDVRLAGASARFDTRFIQLGIHPGGGHTWMLQRICGPQAAFATVVFGEVLDGTEAERIGLVWRCVPDDELLDVAVAMGARAAAGPSELVRTVKQTILDVATIDDHDEAVERELGPQVWSIGRPEFKERLASLQAKITGKA